MKTENLNDRIVSCNDPSSNYCPITGLLCDSMFFGGEKTCKKGGCKVFAKAIILQNPQPTPSDRGGPFSALIVGDGIDSHARKGDDFGNHLFRSWKGEYRFPTARSRDAWIEHYNNDPSSAY